jgi:transcriptional regulator with XRE-family HTH domain
MTTVKDTTPKFAPGTSRRSRTASTFRLELLMEEAQRLEIAARITALRERSPWGQPQIAQKLGIGLRAYQKVERVGTTHFDRCEEIAAIHQEWTQRDPQWAHADAGWIWDGRARGDTPDLLGVLDQGPAGQLDRIEAKLDTVLELLSPPEALEDELDPGHEPGQQHDDGSEEDDDARPAAGR